MSEKFNTPVLLKMVTRVAHSQSIVDTEERVEPDRVPYVKDPAKVMMTLNSRNAHIRVEERTKALIEYAESTELNRVRWVRIQVWELSQTLLHTSMQGKY